MDGPNPCLSLNIPLKEGGVMPRGYPTVSSVSYKGRMSEKR